MSLFCLHDWEYRVDYHTSDELIPGTIATAWRVCRKCRASKFYWDRKPTNLYREPSPREMVADLKARGYEEKTITVFEKIAATEQETDDA